MKRIFTTLYTLVILALAATAQPRFTSNTEMYSCGQIEWKHPTTVQYVITNTGNEPLVLTEVEPDCACSAAQWTSTPIAPGEKGEVNVTFDAEALGSFHKSVAIYTNAPPHLIYLRFAGEVVKKISDFTPTHPYLIGQIRTNRNSIDFPDVQRGEQATMDISVVNLSERPYEPLLMHLPPYLDMEVKPSVLQKGERGIITLTLNSEKLTDLGLTQASVYLSRFMGDKVGEENEIPLSAILLPGMESRKEQDLKDAPVIQLSSTNIDVSQVLARKNRARQDITVSNIGKSPLQISKLQVFHPAVGVSLKKSVLMPGESTRLRVTVEKKMITKKRRQLRLLLITNDPNTPKVEIDIKK